MTDTKHSLIGASIDGYLRIVMCQNERMGITWPGSYTAII